MTDDTRALIEEAKALYAAEARTPAMEYLWQARAMVGRLAAALGAASKDTERLEGELWSFCRRVLGQGQSQQQDYAAGKYANYEELSARVDAAARERAEELLALLARAEPDTEEEDTDNG